MAGHDPNAGPGDVTAASTQTTPLIRHETTLDPPLA
jgi:hypothetical protein